MLILYGIVRSICEIWRDDDRGAVGFLSTSQFISVPLFVLGAWILWWTARQRRATI